MGVHQTRALVAVDGTFQQTVSDAITSAGISIYNEATTITANVKAGTPNATFPVTPNLTAAIPAGTVITVGGEPFVCTAGAALNASSVVTTTTSVRDHFVGEAISPPTVAGHLIRSTYARQVLTSPDNQYVLAWARELASQGFSNASTDAQIDTAVSSAWNAMSGA